MKYYETRRLLAKISVLRVVYHVQHTQAYSFSFCSVVFNVFGMGGKGHALTPKLPFFALNLNLYVSLSGVEKNYGVMKMIKGLFSR